MSKLTRNNIANDLKISPFKLLMLYRETTITFVFSSENYKNKFLERYKENRSTISESLTNRFGITFKCDLLADIKLYSMIEKRGFLIYKGEEKVECLRNITLSGNNLTVIS